MQIDSLTEAMGGVVPELLIEVLGSRAPEHPQLDEVLELRCLSL